MDEQLRWIRVPGLDLVEHRHAEAGFAGCHLDNGILENGAQPARSGQSVLFLDGDILNAPELAQKYRHVLRTGGLGTPALCLALIEHLGFAAAAREFNGLFCIVVFEPGQQRLTLVCDRYGYRPLFFARIGRGLVFGTELKAVAALMQRREIDELGSLELFTYGSHIHDLTWLAGCRRLEPASVLSVDAQGLRHERYWRYRYSAGVGAVDQPSYFTRFAVLLDRAVERCMRSRSHRLGLFLSGGYDSRSVAASIRAEHLPLSALTFGEPQSRDMRFAAMLAERLGMEHVPVYDGADYLLRSCRPIVWRTEGMALFSHTTSLRHHELIRSHMDIILTGFLGEFSGSHTWPGLLATRSRKAAREQIFSRMTAARAGAISRVFSRDFLDRMQPQLRAHFDEGFDTLENEHPIDLADAWIGTFKQPRYTGQASSVDRHVLEMRAPLMDVELVDFLLTVPALGRLEQRVYKKMIAYNFPAIRDIPCTNSGKPIDPVFVREYMLMALRFMGSRATEPVRRAIGARPSLGREPRNLAASFRAEPGLMEQILRPLMRDGIFADAVFDLGGIDSLITEHYEGMASHEDILAQLVSWGLAARYFQHRDLTEGPGTMVDATLSRNRCATSF